VLPDWLKILLSISGAVITAYVMVEVKLAKLETRLEEREKQRLQELKFIDRRLEMFHQEVIRIRDAYHDLRKKTIEAWAWVRKREGRDLGDND
jgi:hypothetical protein